MSQGSQPKLSPFSSRMRAGQTFPLDKGFTETDVRPHALIRQRTWAAIEGRESVRGVPFTFPRSAFLVLPSPSLLLHLPQLCILFSLFPVACGWVFTSSKSRSAAFILSAARRAFRGARVCARAFVCVCVCSGITTGDQQRSRDQVRPCNWLPNGPAYAEWQAVSAMI